jgi:TonB family protein
VSLQRLVRRRQFVNAGLAGALMPAVDAWGAPVPSAIAAARDAVGQAQVEARSSQDSPPLRRRHLSAATQEAVFRGYYATLDRHLRDVAAKRLPTTAGHPARGVLSMDLAIDPAGRLVSVEILRSSGSAALDQQALDIVHASAPFAPFDASMRRVVDQVIAHFNVAVDAHSGLTTTP